ncbi:PilZ domain-containing protein [Candidatus Hydrogenedentota bacterium]
MADEEKRQDLRRESDMQMARELDALRARYGETQDAEEAKRIRQRKHHTIRHSCKAELDVGSSMIAGRRSDVVSRVKIKARVLDLSSGGASLFIRDALDVGQLAGLTIELEGGERLKSTAEVRWLKHIAEKKGYAVGVQFQNISVQDQKILTQFLDQLGATMGM